MSVIAKYGGPRHEIDEIIMRDEFVHLEDMGDWFYMGCGDRQFWIGLKWKPAPEWWGEIKTSWKMREWPRFRRIAVVERT